MKFRDKAALKVTGGMSTWTFIILFLFFLALWMAFNVLEITHVLHFDPYPFILLNLFLSCTAAIQAPIILMAGAQSDKKRDKQLNEIHEWMKESHGELHQLFRESHKEKSNA